MKTLITSTLSGILSFLIFYLLGAFVQASFDISIWSIDARILVGILGGSISIIIMLAIIIHEITKN